MRFLQGKGGWNSCNCCSHRWQFWVKSTGSDYKLCVSSLHDTPGHSKIPKRKGWGETPKLSLLKLYPPLREHPGGDLTLNYLLPITTLCMRSRASLSRTAGIFMGCRFCQSSLEMVFLFIVTEGDSSAVDWAPQKTSDAYCRLNCPSWEFIDP